MADTFALDVVVASVGMKVVAGEYAKLVYYKLTY
jgi:hypothetical protein